MAADQQRSSFAKAAQTIGGFGAGVANTATLGYGPYLAGPLSNLVPPVAGGARSVADIQGEQAALAEQSPKAYRAGQIAGGFVGPVARGTGAVAGLAGKIAKPIVGAAGGLLADAGVTISNEFAKRLLTNLAINAAGSGAAIFTTEALQQRSDDPTLGQRLADAAYNTRQSMTSPLGVGMLVGGSYLQTKLTPPRSAELAKAADRYERITGNQVPPEVLTDSAEGQRFVDAAAQVPGVANMIAKQRKDAINGLAAYLDDIGSQAGAASGGQAANADQAAGALRRLIGTRETPGPITTKRRAIEAEALANSQSSASATEFLKSAVNEIRNTRSGVADSDMERVFTKVEGLRGPVTPQALEDLRAMTADLAQYAKRPPDASGAIKGSLTIKESKLFYTALQDAIAQAAPEYSTALGVAKQLHRLEDALGDVPLRQINDAQAAAVFSNFTPDLWKGLTQFSAPEDLATLKGWYYSRLTSAVATQSGAINPKKLAQITNSPSSPFNRQIVDTVLPGALPELKDYAAFSTKLMGSPGRFGAEGSQTFGRGMRVATTGGVGAAAAVARMTSNPFSAIATILSPIGLKYALRSALGGIINDTVQRGIRQGAQPFGPSAVAVHRGLQSIPQPLGTGPPILSSLPNATGVPAGEQP